MVLSTHLTTIGIKAAAGPAALLKLLIIFLLLLNFDFFRSILLLLLSHTVPSLEVVGRRRGGIGGWIR